MKFTNEQIYQMANELLQAFDNSGIYIPARANFNIQKNTEVLAAAAKEIEKTRLSVAQHYGEPNEAGDSYIIPADKLEEANKELMDLFTMEQDIDIKTFSIETLGDVKLTSAQMHAIMFMIED